MTTNGSLWRVDVDGTDAIALKTGISGASVVAADPVTRIIFYERDSAIVRADSDGANPVDIVANSGSPQTKLIRFNFDGTDLETIDPAPGGQGVGVAVDSSGARSSYGASPGAAALQRLRRRSASRLIGAP